MDKALKLNFNKIYLDWLQDTVELQKCNWSFQCKIAFHQFLSLFWRCGLRKCCLFSLVSIIKRRECHFDLELSEWLHQFLQKLLLKLNFIKNLLDWLGTFELKPYNYSFQCNIAFQQFLSLIWKCGLQNCCLFSVCSLKRRECHFDLELSQWLHQFLQKLLLKSELIWKAMTLKTSYEIHISIANSNTSEKSKKLWLLTTSSADWIFLKGPLKMS